MHSQHADKGLCMQEAAEKRSMSSSPAGDRQASALEQGQVATDDPPASIAGDERGSVASSGHDASMAVDGAIQRADSIQLPVQPSALSTANSSDSPEQRAAVSASGSVPNQGNVRISTEADALRAQAAAQRGGGLAAARAFGDRLLGAPLRDSSEVIRSGLFSLVSSVARAPGSVLGRTASNGTAAAAVTQEPPVRTPPADVPSASAPAAALASGGATADKCAVACTILASLDAERPVRVAIAVRSAEDQKAATTSSSAAPRAAEIPKPPARGTGGWFGRGAAVQSPSPALTAAERQPINPPVSPPAERQPSLPAATSRIGSFFRRGGAVPPPPQDGPARTAAQASGTTQNSAAAAPSSSAAAVQSAFAGDEPRHKPAKPETNAADQRQSAASDAAPGTGLPDSAAASRPKTPSALQLRGDLKPDERRKLRVALQMAAQLRQAIACLCTAASANQITLLTLA